MAIARTITFDINGGSGEAPASQTVMSGTSITLPDGSGFYKSGYIFNGWNTSASGTSTKYDAGSTYTVDHGATFYARWDAANLEGTWEGQSAWSSTKYVYALTLSAGSTYTLLEERFSLLYGSKTYSYSSYGTYTVIGSYITLFYSSGYQETGTYNGNNTIDFSGSIGTTLTRQ